MRFVILLAIMFLAAPVSAAAEIEEPSIRERTADRPEWETRKTLRHLNYFSRCVARKRPQQVDELLRMPLHSSEQDQAVRSLLVELNARDDLHEGCARKLPGDMRLGPAAVLVGGMAEERFLQANRAVSRGQPAAIGNSIPARNDWEDFGLCVVGRNPAGAARLIETEPMSSGERTAMEALAPDFPPCVYQDSKMAMDAFALRTYIAIGLFLDADAANPDRLR